MEKETVLEIRNLSKNFGRIKAVQQLTLEIQRGQVYGILGPNGSGKTTTLSIVTGLQRQDSGSFFWFGQDPSPEVRKKIGSLIEVPHFYPYMNLIQNLKIIAQIKGIGSAGIEAVLDEVGLLNRSTSKYKYLSLGMKQRMGIGAALLGDPELLVLDEPTNGLDPEGIAEVRELIMDQSRKGKTIIMASHILSEVEKVCSHVAILKKGKLLEKGNVGSLIKGEKMVEVSSENIENLKKTVEKCPFVIRVKPNNGALMVAIENQKEPADLNEYLFNNGVRLNRLINHSKSLESQFLELVGNANN